MEVTQIIAWIHRVMLTGLKPATDHLGCEWPPGSRRAMEAGSPFARQLLGAFAGFKSDLEARVLCHRLPRSYMHNFVCEHDLACVHLAHNTVTSEALLGGELAAGARLSFPRSDRSAAEFPALRSERG